MFKQVYVYSVSKQGDLELVISCTKMDTIGTENEETFTEVTKFKTKALRDLTAELVYTPLDDFAWGMFNDQTTLEDVVTMARSQAKDQLKK